MNLQAPLVALVLAAAFCAPATATNVTLNADGAWQEFTVAEDIATSGGTGWIDFADGSPLTFGFTIAAGSIGIFSVVDSGFAGDTFFLTNNGTVFGQTSSVPIGSAVGDTADTFDAAFANPAYSRGIFTLGAGNYSISGLLAQSVIGDDGAAVNSTNGAVRLSLVAAVPEPSTYAFLLAGIGAIGFAVRRRNR